MGNKDNLYDILGVSKTASEKELQKAYRTLSKKYHPDMQSGKTDEQKKEAEEKFKKINEAYATLSDKEKRDYYDRFGTINGNGGGASVDPYEFFRKAHSQFHGFGDFGDFDFGMGGFGNSAKADPNAPKDGDDIQIKIKIKFKDAVFGTKKKFEIEINDPCPDCKGSGAENGELETCPHCKGTGFMQYQKGFMTVRQTCNHCMGSGKTYKNVCKRCGGSGIVRGKHEIDLNVPAGVSDGQRLRLSGAGMCGVNGGRNGDIYVVVLIDGTELFERDGNDIYTNVHIDPVTASLGGSVDVFTPYGMASLTIPPGTDSGKMMKMGGKGIKNTFTSFTGDLYVRVSILPLTNMTKEQEELLNKLKNTITDANNSRKQWYNSAVDRFKNE